MPTLTLTVLGHDGCPATDGVRAALDGAGLAYEYTLLEDHDAYRDGCSFTVPTVLVAGAYGGLRTLVQPYPAAVVGDLARLGVGPSSPLPPPATAP